MPSLKINRLALALTALNIVAMLAERVTTSGVVSELDGN